MAPPRKRAQRPRGKRTAAGSLIELAVIVVVAVGLALLIQAFLVKPYRIPSGSMIPTLDTGQRVLVNRLANNFSSPKRDDIVVFNPPAGADTDSCGVAHPLDGSCPMGTPQKSQTNFIKRVVGVPGDHIKVIAGRVYVNGALRPESFIRPDANCEICNLPREITVPPDEFFMMGDNRGESADSREWGPVPRQWIIGEAFFTYWPPDRIGTL